MPERARGKQTNGRRARSAILFVATGCSLAGVGIWESFRVRSISLSIPPPSANTPADLYLEGPKKTGNGWPGRVQRKRPAHANLDREEPDRLADIGKWFYKIRAFPHQHIPRGARLRAFEQVRRMRLRPESVTSPQASSTPDSADH